VHDLERGYDIWYALAPGHGPAGQRDPKIDEVSKTLQVWLRMKLVEDSTLGKDAREIITHPVLKDPPMLDLEKRGAG